VATPPVGGSSTAPPPQVAVLCDAAVGVFVGHAGWVLVMEGVADGVPMACRPSLGTSG
jgi:anthocyanidin 3-O-glucosyltransferase